MTDNIYAKNNLDRNKGMASWTVRRRIIVTTLIFCAALVAYITYKGTDSRTAETIVQSAFYLAGMVISAYVFGSVYEDRGKINNLNINTGNVTDINPNDINQVMNPNNNIDNPGK